MRIFFIGLSLFILAGCGAQQQRAYGVEDESKLVVRAEQLVGATVSVEPSFKKTITEEDLTPFQLGVPGARNSEEEDLETITVQVRPGTHRIKVEKNGVALINQELYFSQGQTRELRIR